jgi:hypothetical protein
MVGDTLCGVALQAELDAIAAAATALAGPDETLAGVIPAQPEEGRRVYLCAFSSSAPPGGARRRAKDDSDGPERTWVALDAEGRLVRERSLVRRAVSIAALCELAEESAGGGKLEELRAQLVSLRLTEHPEGIEEAEEAALELERTIGAPPRVATPEFLDAVGAATRRLESTLSDDPFSPFAEAMKQGAAVAAELEREVLAGYKVALS